MAEFFEPTIGEQMLAASEEARKNKLGYERAAGQMSEFLGMLGAGPGALQEISAGNAIKGLVKSLKDAGTLKANLPAVRTISKQIAATPQSELDRLTTIGAKVSEMRPGGPAAQTTAGRVASSSPYADITFNPAHIAESAASKDWWHELPHTRQRIPDLSYTDEKGLAEILTGMRDKLVKGPSSSQGWDKWMSLPTERHAIAMQYLMSDPVILKQIMVGGKVDAKMYSDMYNLALKKAVFTSGQSKVPVLDSWMRKLKEQ